MSKLFKIFNSCFNSIVIHNNFAISSNLQIKRLELLINFANSIIAELNLAILEYLRLILSKTM